MAFTGDLEHLNIVDIIQLLHTTRKSGTFSVKGSRGESRIIFSDGYIVGASHLNNKIRIGTVLVRMNALTQRDLEETLDLQKGSGTGRKPLLATLIERGKITHEEATKALRKLIEITIVELIGWTQGTFTLDAEDIAVTPECSYPIGRMEQAASLDSQMVLMEALRIFDERERDREAGREIPSYEDLYADVIPEVAPTNGGKEAVLSADDLGLADVDLLERKMPQFSLENEVFDPSQMHRQKIRETLSDFSEEEQETFVSFLERSRQDGVARQEGRTQSLVLFSEDEFIKHSVLTICKNEGSLVFVTDGEEELDRIVSQCLEIKASPLLVFDHTDNPDGMLSKEKVVSVRRLLQTKYPEVSSIQLVLPDDRDFLFQSYSDGIMAVFPKPVRGEHKEAFIEESIRFLQTLKSYMKAFFSGQKESGGDSGELGKMIDRVLALRAIHEPRDVSLALLQSVAEVFERAITFVVRPADIIGERSLGVFAGKREGPASASSLRIPLTETSVFRDTIIQGRLFFGESHDRALKEYLFEEIGAPLSPSFILLPMKSNGKIMTLTYGDFGKRQASPVQTDFLTMLANEAGIVVENLLYRKLIKKASQK